MPALAAFDEEDPIQAFKRSVLVLYDRQATQIESKMHEDRPFQHLKGLTSGAQPQDKKTALSVRTVSFS